VDIFLDIDGPLIRDGQVTPRCFAFLRWAVELHRPHWLTTRDAHGTHEGILRAFRRALGAPLLPQEIARLLCAVKPTRWRGSKLDAIDLASNWVWLVITGRPKAELLIARPAANAPAQAMNAPARSFHYPPSPFNKDAHAGGPDEGCSRWWKLSPELSPDDQV
jgi:hypothetical protein